MDFTICLTYGLMNGGYNYRMHGAYKPTNITGEGPHLLMGLLKADSILGASKLTETFKDPKGVAEGFECQDVKMSTNYGLFNHNNIIIPNELGSIGPYNKQYTKLFLVSPLVGRLFQLPSSRLA